MLPANNVALARTFLLVQKGANTDATHKGRETHVYDDE